jgi:hypothetical protein
MIGQINSGQRTLYNGTLSRKQVCQIGIWGLPFVHFLNRILSLPCCGGLRDFLNCGGQAERENERQENSVTVSVHGHPQYSNFKPGRHSVRHGFTLIM